MMSETSQKASMGMRINQRLQNTWILDSVIHGHLRNLLRSVNSKMSIKWMMMTRKDQRVLMWEALKDSSKCKTTCQEENSIHNHQLDRRMCTTTTRVIWRLSIAQLRNGEVLLAMVQEDQITMFEHVRFQRRSSSIKSTSMIKLFRVRFRPIITRIRTAKSWYEWNFWKERWRNEIRWLKTWWRDQSNTLHTAHQTLLVESISPLFISRWKVH